MRIKERTRKTEAMGLQITFLGYHASEKSHLIPQKAQEDIDEEA